MSIAKRVGSASRVQLVPPQRFSALHLYIRQPLIDELRNVRQTPLAVRRKQSPQQNAPLPYSVLSISLSAAQLCQGKPSLNAPLNNAGYPQRIPGPIDSALPASERSPSSRSRQLLEVCLRLALSLSYEGELRASPPALRLPRPEVVPSAFPGYTEASQPTFHKASHLD